MKQHKVWVLRLEDWLESYRKLGYNTPNEYTIIQTVDLLTKIQKSIPIGCFTVTTTSCDVEGISEGREVLSALFAVLMQPCHYPDLTYALYYDYTLDVFAIKDKMPADMEPPTAVLLSTVYNNIKMIHYIRDNALPRMYQDKLSDLYDSLHKYEVPCYAIHPEP